MGGPAQGASCSLLQPPVGLVPPTPAPHPCRLAAGFLEGLSFTCSWHFLYHVSNSFQCLLLVAKLRWGMVGEPPLPLPGACSPSVTQECRCQQQKPQKMFS